MKKIVGELSASGKLRQLISPYRMSDNIEVNNELQKDLEQEIAIQLLTHKDKKKIRELYQNGGIDHYILGMLRRQVWQTGGGTFNAKFMKWEKRRQTLIVDER